MRLAIKTVARRVVSIASMAAVCAAVPIPASAAQSPDTVVLRLPTTPGCNAFRDGEWPSARTSSSGTAQIIIERFTSIMSEGRSSRYCSGPLVDRGEIAKYWRMQYGAKPEGSLRGQAMETWLYYSRLCMAEMCGAPAVAPPAPSPPSQALSRSDAAAQLQRAIDETHREWAAAPKNLPWDVERRVLIHIDVLERLFQENEAKPSAGLQRSIVTETRALLQTLERIGVPASAQRQTAVENALSAFTTAFKISPVPSRTTRSAPL